MTITSESTPVRTRRRRQRPAGGQHTRAASTADQVRDENPTPVSGIMEITSRGASLRTTGYLAGDSDVTVPASLVRSAGLRRGDHVTGTAGSSQRGVTTMIAVETVNGLAPAEAVARPDFYQLTPLFPNDRLRLEMPGGTVVNRLIDLLMPIGKGQRALIASPPKAGKTTVLAAIANAIARNNPECHVMLLLIDERPEEVTDMERTVDGEVLSSTFDRRPSDHTNLAELAAERAKRLVESGSDVVLLLDNLTRLGRAYNNSSSSSGRILTGGIDAGALYPPKRFLGAARNVEEGGSLTIIATALVETGSAGDAVIFEEYKGTGNAELKLDRRSAERRVFPAVDVNQSGTRKDELLMAADEHAALSRLRRVLSGLDQQQALDLVVDQLKKTKSNAELLRSVMQSAPA